MEKISSIVPRSRRVAAADLSSAPAVRPGMPSFGRPVGTSTSGMKSVLTTAQKAMVEQNKLNEGRKASALTPELVTEMTDRFFMQKSIPAEPLEVAADNAVADDFTPETPVETESSAHEYVPPGTYLDVSV